MNVNYDIDYSFDTRVNAGALAETLWLYSEDKTRIERLAILLNYETAGDLQQAMRDIKKVVHSIPLDSWSK